MSLTVYCAESDVDFVWSTTGVLLHADDDEDGVEDVDVVANAIEVAASKMNKYLFRRYLPATVAACTWAKWCNAYLAAYQLGIRRGNSIPEPLEREYQEYLQMLKDIEAGTESLPADTGLAAERYDNSPSVTNYTVDARWRRSKVRRVTETSTGGPQAPGAKQYNASSVPYDLE